MALRQANGNYKDGLSNTKWWYHANKEQHKAIQAKYDASPKGQAAKARINSRRRDQHERKKALLLLKEKENAELFQKLKRCGKCREHKPLSEFFRHTGTRDGRGPYCKPCTAERVRKHRKQNPAMYEGQKRRNVAAMKARWQADPEPKRQYERARYARERDKYRAKMRKQYTRHTAKYKINAARRRARLAGVWTAEGDEYAAFVALDQCVYCGGPSTGIDHITPLAAGGTHTADNLAPACRTCNISKQSKSLLHFLLYRSA